MSAFLTVALLGYPASSDQPDVTGPQPAVQVAPIAIDFGTVARQSCHEQILRISNSSGQPLTLLDSGSNCDCLSNDLVTAHLPAGETAEWRVTLNTCDYLGDVQRHVWVRTDHPDHPRLKVPMRYRVVPELFTEPDCVSLGLLGEGTITTEVLVQTLAAQSFHLLTVSCSDPGVTVELSTEEVSCDHPGRIRICVAGPLPEGRYRPRVLIETTSSEVPQLRIPLFGESVVGLRCDQRAAVFAAVPAGNSETCRLTFSRDAGVRIGGIRTSNEAANVQAVQRTAGRVIVTLRSSRRQPLGAFRGFLLLEVNNGQRHKVKFPYRGRVMPMDVPVRPQQVDSSNGG